MFTSAGNSKSGLTLIEVSIATVLLILGLTSFLAAFAAMQRASATTDNCATAITSAREMMEAIMAQPYDSTALNIGTHTFSNGYYTVTLSPSLVTTKDITVIVNWLEARGGTASTIELHGAMAKCIH